jgi:hypothetical protein
MDEAEVERIRDVLSKYENFDLIGLHTNLAVHESDDLVTAHAGFILEENLSAISTGEIIRRLDNNLFADDSLRSALRVLRSRLVGNTSK